MEDPKFKIGMYFSTPKDFKAAMKQRAILHQRPVKLAKNDKRRIKARCEKPCQWEVYAAKVLGESSYQVRTYSAKNSCIKTYTNRNTTSHTIARRYMEDLRTNPWMPIQSFKDRIRKEMKVDVSMTQLYRAKRKAAQLLYGSNVEQYGRLWDYCEELRRSNPGSTVVMDASIDDETEQPRFNRLYVFLAAPKIGFLNGCRKIVGLDGYHLKGEYSGQLHTTVGVDANDAMYPMAYSVVETESKDTWTWFSTLLKMDLKITGANEQQWTFISDRQKGLLSALEEEVPRAEKRHCAKHLLTNFQKRFKGVSLEEKFWACFKATTVAMFQDTMEEMKKESQEAYDWLALEPPRGSRSGVQVRGGGSGVQIRGGRSGVQVKGGRIGFQIKSGRTRVRGRGGRTVRGGRSGVIVKGGNTGVRVRGSSTGVKFRGESTRVRGRGTGGRIEVRR
ncbi:hypothetical protein Vadar_003886 [Vaccinium darrowii]|uniref:Uncharacterized protein n=1 Tax=Vaccinium darrowii TaxID=229202 RepID=A0ACB7XP59_9ERIC|nr:hypothetical protein Vadar_003886 [Vaccinium darrowii]